jgi:hypothetical protein
MPSERLPFVEIIVWNFGHFRLRAFLFGFALRFGVIALLLAAGLFGVALPTAFSKVAPGTLRAPGD